MGKLVRTANGKMIDMDRLRLENEDAIAVGNMKVNAKGEKLGPGGQIAKTRGQVMSEHYKTQKITEQEAQKAINSAKTQGAQVKQGKVKGSK